MRRGRAVCPVCDGELEIRWVRVGKMSWVKEGEGARRGRMLRFFCPRCRRFVKPYPPGSQAKLDRW